MNSKAVANGAQSANPRTEPPDPMAEEFIRSCGGDAREAVRALLGANEYLEGRVRVLEDSVSWAYLRRQRR